MKRVKQNVQDILLAIQRGELGLADARQLAEELEQELKLYRQGLFCWLCFFSRWEFF
jgi:hypothetical protein